MFVKTTITEADLSDASPPVIDTVKTADGYFECHAMFRDSIDGDVYVRYPGLHKEKRENVDCDYDQLPLVSANDVARMISPEKVYEKTTKSNRFTYKCPFCNKKNRKYLITKHMGDETCSYEGQAFAFLLPAKDTWPPAYKPIRV